MIEIGVLLGGIGLFLAGLSVAVFLVSELRGVFYSRPK